MRFCEEIRLRRTMPTMGVGDTAIEILLRRRSARTRTPSSQDWAGGKVRVPLRSLDPYQWRGPHPTELLMIADREIGEDTSDEAVRMPDLYARMTNVFP